MGRAGTIAEITALIPEVLDVVKSSVAQLASRNANPLELIIKRHISKDPFEYSNRSKSAIVSQTLVESGVKLSPGESIQYIITDASGKRDPMKAKPLALYALEDGHDAAKYSEMVLDAAETLLLPLGYSVERLKEELGLVSKKRKKVKLNIQRELQFEE